MSRALVAFSRPRRRLIVIAGRQLLTHTPTEHSDFRGMAIWRRLEAQCEGHGRRLGQQHVQLEHQQLPQAQGRSYLCQVFQAVPVEQVVQQGATEGPVGTGDGGSGGVGGSGRGPAGRMPPPRALHVLHGDAWNGGLCGAHGVRGAAVAAVGCGVGGGMGLGKVQSGRAGLGMGLGLGWRREVGPEAGRQRAAVVRAVPRVVGFTERAVAVRGAGDGGAPGSGRGLRGVVRVVG